MQQSFSQLDEQQHLRHLLTMHNLPKATLLQILDRAEVLFNTPTPSQSLLNKNIFNLFFEASTRTRLSFEVAAKKLGATVVSFDVGSSSVSKGESLLDTLHNLEAMGVDIFVVRHSSSGAAEFLARHRRSHAAIINAGDGWHAHPTQALLDMLTIRRHKTDFSQLKVAIVGDIRHSRVARSNIYALHTLGAAEIRVVGPKTLIPDEITALGVKVFYDLKTGLKDVDVIIMLRVQRERMQGAYFPSTAEYFRCYGLSQEQLAYAKSDAIIMHPGPINREVEISAEVANGGQSVILEQVPMGVAVRMAVMEMVCKI